MQDWSRPTGSQPNRDHPDRPHNGPSGPWTRVPVAATVGRVRVAIIGAGPTGLFLGAALQRRGHAVTVVDRDGGPESDGSWPRKGVMQFHHAHGFRAPVVGALKRELPEVVRALGRARRRAGDGAGEHRAWSGCAPRGRPSSGRCATWRRPSLGWCCARGTCAASATSTGWRSASTSTAHPVPAELVLDASGRASAVTKELGERDGFGGECGIAYVDRLYRLRPGAQGGPLNSPSPGRATTPATRCWSSRTSGAVLDGDHAGQPRPPSSSCCVTTRRTTRRARRSPGSLPGPIRRSPSPRVRCFPGGSLLNHYRGQRAPTGSRC